MRKCKNAHDVKNGLNQRGHWQLIEDFVGGEKSWLHIIVKPRRPLKQKLSIFASMAIKFLLRRLSVIGRFIHIKINQLFSVGVHSNSIFLLLWGMKI